MANKKITQLPFLLIVGFSLIVMLAVVVAQYRSQNGISQLRNGNTQALITFKVDNWLDEIVNETYVMEEEAKKFITTDNKEHFTNLQKAIQNLHKENAAIESLDMSEDSSRQMIVKLTSLVQKKTAPYLLLQERTPDSTKQSVLFLINAPSARQLTDSIYIKALQIQIVLGKNLESTIVKNEALSSRVLSFSWMMGFISIAAIAILASIIIRRLLQNFKLIKALERAKTDAEKASMVKEQFLANMSHEIRTPVNSVLGFTNLLEKTGMKENQTQFVSLIKTAGEHLLNIINDILDLSKIESGMLQFTSKPFNVRKLCYDVEMMFYHQLTEKNLVFNCVIDDNVPAVITGDKERLTQVLMNLVNNAIKFTDKGTVVLQVALLDLQSKKVQLQFSVKDTGIGIKEEKLQTIFERFEQAEASTTRKYGGTGLGLSIVKNLVELQGGTIEAKSNYGEGAEFLFDLSFEISYDALLDDRLTKADNRFSSSGMIPVGAKILVAEDNKMNQQLIEYLFKSWGMLYEFAETGIACIEKLRHQKFDLVFMDIQMPEMDGYEAASVIRQQLKLEIPIIAMTANVLPGEREKCLQLGMNDYLAKPVDEHNLKQVAIQYLPKTNSDENPLVNLAYLNQTFGNNQQFIQKMIEEFNIQYPKDLAALQQAIDEKSIAMVRTKSHHLKTTISTVNMHSPFLACLEALEKADDTVAGWHLINQTMHRLNMQQAESMLQQN